MLRMPKNSDETDGKFYGVYLLLSESEEARYRGKCYIGYTVNPKRRICQHNRGKLFGGAKKTNSKGPWKMIMIVHGFPNNVSALQFEWAWQQPALSTRLKNASDLKRKLKNESNIVYKFRILNRMLSIAPWCRLSLIIRWFEEDYKTKFSESTITPPKHMQIVCSEIAVNNENQLKLPTQHTAICANSCHLCLDPFSNTEQLVIRCQNKFCKLTSHLICLANNLIASNYKERGQYIPIFGECPLCKSELMWGSLLRKQHTILEHSF